MYSSVLFCPYTRTVCVHTSQELCSWAIAPTVADIIFNAINISPSMWRTFPPIGQTLRTVTAQHETIVPSFQAEEVAKTELDNDNRFYNDHYLIFYYNYFEHCWLGWFQMCVRYSGSNPIMSNSLWNGYGIRLFIWQGKSELQRLHLHTHKHHADW